MESVNLITSETLRAWETRFLKAAECVRDTQRTVLAGILEASLPSAYLGAFGLESASPAEYRARVPVSTYADVAGHIARMQGGAAGELYPGHTASFVRSSGTTGHPRYLPQREIPEEHELLVQIDRHFDLACFLREHPDLSYRGHALRPHRGLWLTFAGAAPAPDVNGGVSSFLSGAGFQRAFATCPAEHFTRPEWLVGDVPSDERLYALMRISAGQRIHAISGFAGHMVELPRLLARRTEDLLRDLRDGTLGAVLSPDLRAMMPRLEPRPDLARQYERYARCDGGLEPRHLYPALRVVRTFTGGNMRTYRPFLRQLYDAPVRDFGLVSSEAHYIGVPQDSTTSAFIPAIHTNYLEFQDSEGRLHEMADVMRGRSYRLVVTTRHGLYRYDTKDLVRVMGFRGSLPILEFEGRDRVSDLLGEKLSENDVAVALEKVAGAAGVVVHGFVVDALPPTRDTPATYHFVIESSSVLPHEAPVLLSEALAGVNCNYKIYSRGFRIRVTQVEAGTFSRLRALRMRRHRDRDVPQEKPAVFWCEGIPVSECLKSLGCRPQ